MRKVEFCFLFGDEADGDDPIGYLFAVSLLSDASPVEFDQCSEFVRDHLSEVIADDAGESFLLLGVGDETVLKSD